MLRLTHQVFYISIIVIPLLIDQQVGEMEIELKDRISEYSAVVGQLASVQPWTLLLSRRSDSNHLRLSSLKPDLC